jgi:hypothetical protein
MKYVVKIHRQAQESVEAWLADLSRTPGGDPAMARFQLEELKQTLIREKGESRDVQFDNTLDPEAWVWPFASNAWVVYGLKRSPTRWPFEPTTVIVILAILRHAPA